MKRFVVLVLGLLMFVGICFADDVMFKPFGDRYDADISTSYVLNVIDTNISTINVMIKGLGRYVANPTSTTVFYTFYSTPTITTIGLPLYTSGYMNMPDYFGAIYFKTLSGTGTTIRVGEIKGRY